MTELTWFDQYDGQSTDELNALDGRYRTDSLVAAFEQAIDQKEVRIGPENLTDEERIIQAVEWLEREVNNGGYHLYFSKEAHSPDIVAALKRIGCDLAASITQAAIDGSVTIESVRDAIDTDDETLYARLSECDGRYYDEVGDLSEPLLAFIKNNRDKIVLVD